ncbi:MAG: cytochrome c biogenesis protein ResB [Syntrophobacteraceae bacterium]
MSKDQNLPGKILDWLASLKLTLILFFALAAASVIGTLLPQGMSSHDLHTNFPATASMIELLGLNNLYHSTWFKIMLLLLCTNLLACTLDRLPKTVRIIQRREEPFDSNKLTKFSCSRLITTKMSQDEAKSILTGAVSEFFGDLRELPSPGPFCAVSEKGRWSRLMVYGVHLSVLVVLVGALMGSILGFKGFMNLDEGKSSDKVVLAGGQESLHLPFIVKCEDFDVSYYDTGAPKEFRSDLTIIEDGKEVLKQSIIVNDPLTYKGITFYQSSYGSTLRSAEIELKDRDSGKTSKMNLPFHELQTVPGTGDRIQIVGFSENMRGAGPAFRILMAKEGQDSFQAAMVLADHPEFHGNRIHNYGIRVLRTDKAFYTGLQVKKDPGVLVVWIGFTLMIIGIGMTFYSSHRKLWACAEPDKKGKGIIVTVAGRTSRNAPGFGERFNELCVRLENQLKPEKDKRVQK